MPVDPASQVEANKRNLAQIKKNSVNKTHGKIAAGTVLTTAAVAALSNKKTRQKIGKGISKGAKAVASVFKKKEGEYMENPATGKMERVKSGSPKVSNMSSSTKKALKNRKK